MKVSAGVPVDDEARYRAIFEHAAVSLWEADISPLRARLRQVRETGLDLRQYLRDHPEFVQEARCLIEVTDANQATLRLMGVDRKEQVLGPISAAINDVSESAMQEIILAIDEGRSDVEIKSAATGMDGRSLYLMATLSIPGEDSAYTRMVASLMDLTARKEAEERERLRADILQSTIESIPDAVFVKDRALRMVVCNAVHSGSVGKQPSETVGKTDIENGWDEELVRGNPSTGIRGWEKDDLAALNGRTVLTNAVPSNYQGSIRYFDATRFPLRDRSGAIIGVIGIAREVTRQSQLEKELAWEKHLLSTLMDSLPDGFYFKDLQSRFIRISRSLAAVLGVREPGEATGKTDADFFSPDHAERAFADEQRIIETGAPLVDVEERETYPDRPDSWVITTKMPLRSPAGEIVGTFGISHNITERKKLEEKNQQLAALVESADDAIVGTDLERRITVWNPGAERIYGYTTEEMIGAPEALVIPPDMEDEARQMRDRAMQGERLSHRETVRRRKDGVRIIVSLTLSAIRDAQGAIVGLASVARDVTKQKVMEAQLNRAQRLESLVTLAGGVAHHFNNINAVVKGYLGILRADRELSERLRGFVMNAEEAVDRAVGITDRLLMMTEPARDPSATVRLDLLAGGALANLATLLSSRGIQLVLELAQTPAVPGDERRLRFVVSSLVTNALDALLDRPLRVLSVRTGRAENRVFLEVEDTGCGIPTPDLPRIFSPFFSTKGEWAPSGAPQARLKGLGLDLATCSMAVTDYGGTIEVRSTEGTGSVFTVLLPLAGRGTAEP